MTIHPSISKVWKRFELDRPATELESQAFNWIRDNEEAFLEMCVIAQEAYYDRHYEHWGIAACAEVLRWQRPDIMATVKGRFGINNNHKATFARLINEHLNYEFFRIRGNKGHVSGE